MRAMRGLVAELKKKKFAASSVPGAFSSRCSVDKSAAWARDAEPAGALPRAASMTRDERGDRRGRASAGRGSPDALPPACGGTDRETTDAFEQHEDHDQHDHRHPRRRGRHIPAAVRRTVFERDGNRCTYVDANGGRCRETYRIEFHHLKPFATGGNHLASNLTLRCAAHNAFAAEEDFGRELIEDRKKSLEHEPCGLFEDELFSAL